MTAHLTVHAGGGEPSTKPGWPTRLTAAVIAAWEAETTGAAVLGEVAGHVDDARVRARLYVLAAFYRAHASRLRERVNGRPMPVTQPVHVFPGRVVQHLRGAAASAQDMARRYESMTEAAKACGDMRLAWVAELNRTESQDAARELKALVDSMSERKARR